MKKETSAQVFSRKYLKIFNNAFYIEHLWVTTSINVNTGL